ncbi:FAD binding domain-containing protein [Piscinibacter gummiphilus]|uniref:Uncharacterized protein n=1 Tax=Piscinibacter gummiphilus TaxID=946333 RepID=A0A1W6L3A6_9BURK|nr:FAD binding domain-containing protein [Piscinibacter gummiphilus]ARN18703.1 hypothetical protein A4W93_01520 [Piscinibacter gummiphilus]ATU63340.1 molybdopterin dehydrogenase [Piscinibacter gummiphilus]GLS95850.1 xanthine dehydrogenase [Piscinibacter gummiphilus]
MTYLVADRLDDALSALAREPHRIVCGATDCYAEPVPGTPGPWLDISRIGALRGIRHDGDCVHIGAITSWDDIDTSPRVPRGLREAARGIGSRQIRVQGTVGGNLCHAAPAADGVPALLALQARVQLASARGLRELPLEQFVLGRRRTALRSDELLSAVVFDAPGAADTTAFVKCTHREGPALAVVSAAVRLRWRECGVVASAMVAVGAASEVPCRVRAVEAGLEGADPSEMARRIAASPLPELAPIDDCRGSSALRLHLARVAIARACERAGRPA